jgi:hypothetical protein
MKAEEVLEKNSIDEYEKGIDFFYDQLVKLNTNIFIIKKIYEFPFDIFCSPEDKVFFSMVIWNFYENSVLTVTKLATDQKGDVYTLPKFKNWIYKQVKSKYISDLRNWLKKSRFDSETKRILKNAQDLRDKMIAHFNKNLLFNMGKVKHINIRELEKLKDKFNFILNTLSFNIGHEMLPLPYSESVIRPKGVEHRSDIDSILDSIAKNSTVLNMPEMLPEKWEYTKESYDEEGIKTINKYRKKFSLPEVYKWKRLKRLC